MVEGTKAVEKVETSFWRSLFDDISIAQLLAGALAAVTSMLLASRIGIAGSVIGVAVGSIVSAVASQVYKKFLSASAEKLKDMAPDHGPFAPPSRRAAQADDAVSGAPTMAIADVSAAETVAIPAAVSDDASAGVQGGPASARAEKSDSYAEAARARSRAARARKAKIQRNAVIVAALSALLAIALSAVVIELATDGQGMGAKPEPIVPSTLLSAPAKDAVEPAQGGEASGANGSSDQGGAAPQASASNEESAQGGSSDAQGSQTTSPDGQQSGSAPSESGAVSPKPGQGDAGSSGSQGSAPSGQGSSSGSGSASGGSSDASGSAPSGQTPPPGASSGSSGQADSSTGGPAASVVFL